MLKMLTRILAVATLCLMWGVSSFASAIDPGQIVATFSNPIFSGYAIVPPQGTILFQDTTGTAVFSGLGTDSFSWGTNTHVPPPPISSTFVFIGGSITGLSLDQPFSLGTFIYTNGTSRTGTAVYGIDLTFSVPGYDTIKPVTPFTTHITMVPTQNTGVNAFQNADFASFSSFPDTFNVFEGATASAQLIGQLHGDPFFTLDGLVLDPGQGENGFIGNGFPSVPEPATLTLFGLGALGALLRRRKNP